MNDIITIIVGFLLFIGFTFFLPWLFKRFQLISMVEKLPGPKAYPLIGTTWLFFGVGREGIFNTIDARSKKYPNICRVWVGSTPEIRLSTAEDIEKIISSTKNIEKSMVYKFVKTWLGEGLLTSNGQRWFKHRRIITPTFHFKILDNFCEIFSEKSDILVECLEKYADTNEVVDIYPFIAKAALDIICMTAMGTDINAQNNDDNEYVKSIYQVTELTMRRLLSPWLHPKFLFDLSSIGKIYSKNLKVVHGFTSKVIEDRKNVKQRDFEMDKKVNDTNDTTTTQVYGGKNRLAFLDLLLAENREKNVLTDQDIREEVDTFMFEGHDTTTAGISWSLFLIGLHNDVQEKLIEEIDSIFDGSNRTITLNDLNQMKYLERVIKEALRLYPPVAFIGRQLSDDIELSGYKVPKECMIAIQIYHLHRDPRYFPDPEKFDPERFLPENSENRHPYAYLPFSGGPRNCIGQKFAMYEEKSVICSILRKYKIKSVDKREDVNIMAELILRPQNGVRLLLEKRRHYKNLN